MLSRLVRKSPKELYQRAARRMLDELELLMPAKQSSSLSFTAPLPTPWDSAEAITQSFLTSGAPISQLLERAELALSGTLSLLGYPPRAYGLSPDWHIDPVSGRSSPRVPWLRVPFLNAEVVGDHKVVWELNRHQWITWLAQGFVLTGEERFADAAFQQIARWIHENPPRIGINWVSSLEISIRSIQWTAILHLLRKSRHATPIVLRSIGASIEMQIQHVSSHLSTWFAPNTHLTAEALGLVIIGTAFPEFRSAASHVRRGRGILEAEARRQIRDDGGYFEQSSWYQAYTVDIYVEAARWLDFASQPFDLATKERVRSSAEFLRQCCHPDGTLVRFGDDDGGSLWRTGTGDAHRATLARASMYFSDEKLLAPGAEPDLSDCFLYAAASRPGVAADPVHSTLTVWAAPQTGILRIDDRGRSLGDTIVLDAGPHGSYGHPHADALAIDLSLGGVPLIVDPGTGTYFGDVRQRLRMTGAHATLEVEGCPAAEVGGAFAWNRACDGTIVRSGVCPPFAWAEGTIVVSGGESSYQHTRTVLRVSSRAWFVLDHVRLTNLSAPRRVFLRWTLAPEIQAQIEERSIRCSLGQRSIAIVVADNPHSTAMVEGTYSSAYGNLGTAQVIETSTELASGGDFCTVFSQPGMGPSLVRDERGLPMWRYRDRLGELVIAQPRGVPVDTNGALYSGDWAIVSCEERGALAIVAGEDSLHPGPEHRLSKMIGDVRLYDVGKRQ